MTDQRALVSERWRSDGASRIGEWSIPWQGSSSPCEWCSTGYKPVPRESSCSRVTLKLIQHRAKVLRGRRDDLRCRAVGGDEFQPFGVKREAVDQRPLRSSARDAIASFE